MADVARLANVSHQTVSRVLNSPDLVRPETRERVLQAIAELGYRRNMGARALVTRRSRLVGVVVAETDYSGPGQTSTSVQMAARALGYGTLVAAMRENSAEEVEEVLDLLLEHAVEGIVVIAPQIDLVGPLTTAAGRVPQVLVADSAESPPGTLSVSVDQLHGATLATQHLISLGHRDIVHLSGPLNWFDAAQRERGWRETMRASGLPVRESIAGDWSPDCGYSVGVKLCERHLPDAVFASNDAMALGLLAAFAAEGVRVPQDISVIGYDDTPGAAFFQPSLTTVRQPFQALGETSVAALLDLIRGNETSAQRILPTLVQRRTTGVRAEAT